MSLQAHGAWRRWLVAAVFGTAVLVAAGMPARALAAAPHVVTDGNTDTCAMCHRTHTAAGEATWQDGTETTHSALLVSPAGGTGQTGFCYTCHGAEAAGADSDVQSSFLAPSHHSIEPSASAYGPSPKQCSDCHDSHGTARTATGSPYPGLLRSRTSTRTDVHSGEEYCATCHADRPADRWDGLGVYRQTKHYSALPTPTTGTDIRCSICHQSHGSTVAPLLQRFLTPPSVPATVEVTADDRTFCFDCHPSASATYPGRSAYQASAHGLSSQPVTVTGEWPSSETTRAAGECQVCHAAMGRSDGAGGAIPKLAEKAGVSLCLTCHSVAGLASTDFAALSYPATATPMEIVASWSPATSTADHSRIALYGQDPASAPPRELVGPREFRLPSAGLGVIASGDFDADGRSEIVAAKPGSASLALFAPDRLRGLTPLSSSLVIAAPADLLAAGDFLGTGRPQIAVVSRSDSRLRLYAYDSGGLSELGSAVAVDAGASSIAAGDVTGTASPDVVVTAATAAKLDVFTGSGGTMTSAGAFDTGSNPTGASIGDAWPGGSKSEIVVLLGGGPGAFSIYDGAGTDIRDYLLSGTPDLTPTASAVGDLLRSVGPTDTTSGKEIAVTLASDSGDSRLEVFVQQAGGGYEPAQTYTTGSRYASGSLALGDVDGDGVLEAVVGNAGRWAVDADRQLASLQVFHAASDESVLAASPTFLPAGGVELAGTAPSLALADIGAGPSRHPWGAVAKAHVSTETVPAVRHVECTDCHEVHEATSTPVASTAPTASGEITGSSGVAVTNDAAGSVTLTAKSRIDYQYELCFKCHSGWVPLAGRADTAMQFNTKNASFHAVEGQAGTSANSGTFAGSWGNSSVMYCTDCHANADAAAPKGPHTSDDAPILQRPYLGRSPADSNGLCYKCHSYDVYYTGGAADSGSAASFFATAGGAKLHSAHTSGWGLGCSACHVSHGSVTQKHLIGNGTTYVETAGGGTCTNGCHPGGRSYAR